MFKIKYAHWNEVRKTGYEEITVSELQELVKTAKELSGRYCICSVTLVKVENDTFYFMMEECEC